MDKKKVHFLVRTPTNGVYYDVPTLNKAIDAAKAELNDCVPGAEVRIYQLVRIVRTPLVPVEEEFADV